MRRRGPTGEAGDGEVETAPKEMNRTCFAEELRAKRVEHAINPNEHAEKWASISRIICGVVIVFLKGNGVRNFARHRPDLDLYSQATQTSGELGIKGRDRHRLERERLARPVARFNQQSVVDKIESHVER